MGRKQAFLSSYDFKYEEVYIKQYESPREARQNLTAYLRFYNEQRVHQSLDYHTHTKVYYASSNMEINLKPVGFGVLTAGVTLEDLRF